MTLATLRENAQRMARRRMVLGLWLLVKALLLAWWLTGCIDLGWSWPSLPHPAPNDAGVHRVRGDTCPARERWLYIEERAERGGMVRYSWCRDTIAARRAAP